MSILFILYLLSAFIYSFMGVAVISYDSKKVENRLFFLIAIIMSAWASLTALMTISPTEETATYFRLLSTFAWGILYNLLLHFFIVLSKRKKLIRNPLTYIFLYVPSVFAIYLYYFAQPVSPAEIKKTHFGWVYNNALHRGFFWDQYMTILFMSCVLLSIYFLWSWRKNTPLKREKKQSQILILSLVTVVILGTFTDIILPLLGTPSLPPLVSILSLIPIAGIWYSMRKYKLMRLNYENMTLDLIKIIDEGLVIVAQDGSILEVNQGAVKILEFPAADQMKGQSIRMLFPDNQDITEILSARNKELNLLKYNGRTLPVLLHSITIQDSLGDALGSLVSFQDLSEIARVQEELRTAYDDLENIVQERTHELRMANVDLEKVIQARQDAEERIVKIAYYDHLTNLPNRRLFVDRLEQAILSSDRIGDTLALLYLDIDYFKMVNDTLGHARGDDLLQAVAERLTRVVRKTDTIARLGGDEFIILLQDLRDILDIETISQKVLDCFKAPFVIDGKELYVTSSIGLSAYPIDGTDSDTLIKNADLAMYRAKENGKNRVETCTIALKTKIDEDMKMANSLYHALERNELELFFQPQVNSLETRIVGTEALLRWHHPELGMVSPLDFIPIAEHSGLIVPIGEWVIHTACRQNKSWQDQGFEHIPVAVNISVKQFHNAEIVHCIRKALEETGLEPKDLVLEITESIVMKDVSRITATLQELKKIGVRVAIDDFGTEYASLRYLKQLPIDTIKIAMTFIQGIHLNPQDENITEAIILLAQKMHLQVIAEGVENKEQLDFLSRFGCNIIQGFYFYRPLPTAGIPALLSRNES